MSYINKVIKFGNGAKHKTQNTKHILLCGDKNYIKYCGVTLTSILLSNPDESFTFHIFCDDLSTQDAGKLKATALKFHTEIKVYLINLDLFDNFSKDTHGKGHLSMATYFRFVALGELPINIDKVLYLDSDILVRGDISAFWAVNMDDKCTAVIEDISGARLAKRLKINKYFNAGVLFIDLKKWKEQNYTSVCIKEAIEKDYEFLDQDILNVVLDGQFVLFNKFYNYYYSLSRLMDESLKPSLERLPKEVKICHFNGASKPWHSWVQCIDAVKEYNAVKEQSFWNDNKIVTPFEMKKNRYKYMHKFARLSKKEGNYKDMLYWYINYSVNKIFNIIAQKIKK